MTGERIWIFCQPHETYSKFAKKGNFSSSPRQFTKNLQLQFGFLKQTTSKNVEHLQQAINVQQTCMATICTYINNILPHIMKLEQTILQLQQKITTEQDTVQINAPDFDPDIDGPNLPRTHNNTAVVSVQEHLTPSEPEVLDATDFKAEEDTARESGLYIQQF